MCTRMLWNTNGMSMLAGRIFVADNPLEWTSRYGRQSNAWITWRAAA